MDTQFEFQKAIYDTLCAATEELKKTIKQRKEPFAENVAALSEAIKALSSLISFNQVS